MMDLSSASSYAAALARLTVIIGISVLAFVVGGWLVTRIAVSGPADRVPDIVGMDAQAAEAALAEAGMTLETQEDRLQVDTIPADHVARQTPAAGTPVKRVRGVRVMLSTGPLERSLPDLVNDSRQRAREQEGIAVDYVASAPSYDVARDTIIAQSPEPGAGDEARPLRLLASLGPPPTYYVMPNLVSLPVTRVRGGLESLGFRVSEGPNRRVYANVPPGTIVSQRPQPGFRIADGGQIVLQVSR